MQPSFHKGVRRLCGALYLGYQVSLVLQYGGGGGGGEEKILEEKGGSGSSFVLDSWPR